MGASLLAIGGAHAIGRLSGSIDRWGKGPRARTVDRFAIAGVATVLVITYVAAALHKMNAGFLGPQSIVVRATNTFFIYGDLGDTGPAWAIQIGIVGTLIVEAVVPLCALRFRRHTSAFVVVLMLFHFPHVAVMNVADYPMIASAFYPALYSAGGWRILERQLYAASRYTIGGALVGIAAQLWWIPYWGALTIFGILVTALWGWYCGAVIATRFRKPRS